MQPINYYKDFIMDYRTESAFNERAYESVKRYNEWWLEQMVVGLDGWIAKSPMPDGIKSEVKQIVFDLIEIFKIENHNLIHDIEKLLTMRQTKLNGIRLNNLLAEMVDKRLYWDDRAKAVAEVYLRDDPFIYNPLTIYTHGDYEKDNARPEYMKTKAERDARNEIYEESMKRVRGSISKGKLSNA